MSTFKGFVEGTNFPTSAVGLKDFPTDVADLGLVDYFRELQGKSNPLACFLSHVHSDHLQGLESFHSPFIYCSPSTRELLLRLEKCPNRMNYHRGILESRKQDYKHLGKVLKTIPLDTPTKIELKPGKSLRVTLLDANHCAGAVMFLIENGTKAILYTGDVRSEFWWVSSIARHPVILPYTHGLKRIDKIYLDTTFASKKNQYRNFPTKADGLKELLGKVSEYSFDTVFHIHAWTFGYEDVWNTLSSALGSQIHVDDYKYSLYKSLASTAKGKNACYEGSALYGFECGNNFHDGCLTTKRNVRLHSCQQDMGCSVLEASNLVYIRPIITRSTEGNVLPEVGAGGGAGDLNQMHELELNDVADVKKLIELCKKEIPDQEIQSKTIDLIDKAKEAQCMGVPIAPLELDDNSERMSLAELVKLLAKYVVRDGKVSQSGGRIEAAGNCVGRGEANTPATCPERQQPRRIIEFPYSRHSSYEELCNLVKAFEPIDVYPCTIDEEFINLNVTIASLFGHLCFGSTFSHDKEMELLASQRETLGRDANFCESQVMNSPERRSFKQKGTIPVSFLGSTSGSKSRALDDLEREPKRQRSGLSFLRNLGDEFSTSSLRIEGIPRSQLSEFKQSFKSYMKQSKKEMVSSGNSAELPLNCSSDITCLSRQTKINSHAPSAAPQRQNDQISNSPERLANCQVDSTCGRQSAPIEFTNVGECRQVKVASDSVLEEISEPGDKPNALVEDQFLYGTQITLPDAAFESQSQHESNRDLKAMQMQQRMEAYKAAKDPKNVWRNEYGFVSSYAHHGEEEVEL